MPSLFIITTLYSRNLLPLLTIFLAAVSLNACNGGGGKRSGPVQPTFKQHWGKGFTEVRRNFKNGVSFSDYGYQLEPEWALTFLNDDSVNIYNPKTRTWGNAPVLFDHDSIFNIAWAYLRLRKQTRDSIIFQVMKVEGRELSRDRSVVYMTLYANDYIRNVLHTDAKSLIHPDKKDSLYIQRMALKANADTSKAFAGRQPAVLKSRSGLVTVTRQVTAAENKKQSGLPEDYLLPEYNISISKAYDDFSYSFTVVVNEQGKLLFVRSLNFMFPEFVERTNKVMRAITDGYLKAYLAVTPGSTLGIPHSSIIIVHVKGVKGR